MLGLRFETPTDRPLRVLCLGAHCDDIEIGCGGTVLRLLAEVPETSVAWMVFSSTPARAEEARCSAGRFLARAGAKRVEVMAFRDGYFPYHGEEIKDRFEALKDEAPPDLIFTHGRDDRHQDHRLVCELTWNTFRDHAILEYEIPKYDGDLGQPNLFVTLEESICRDKIEAICECFASQRSRHWFTPETLMALLRIRGVESASPTRYAEGFHCRKGVIR